eukprot:TRINITY_DN54059_c0_g1_i1.p1 TRINITY_DN54059_c0_g1~~TRINITY_DN54059_c0_g1_i1.p1  ORF type:complete len:265 (+),score=58.25 TRINITY_DN54059_c0_g1_i1:81-875(+)
MGLGEALFLHPSEISDTLKCPICSDVFEDPVFCGQACQHAFCRSCVEQAMVESCDNEGDDPDDESAGLARCPRCQAEIRVRDLRPHQVLCSLLGELPVRCRLSCGWTGRSDALPAHESPGPEQCPLLQLQAAQEQLSVLSVSGLHLQERDSEIAQLEAIIAEQDLQMVEVGRQLLAHEVKIAELEARYEKQERELTQKDVELAFLRRGRLLPASPVLGSYPQRERGKEDILADYQQRERGESSSAHFQGGVDSTEEPDGTDLWL